jgi:hypothetical protein
MRFACTANNGMPGKGSSSGTPDGPKTGLVWGTLKRESARLSL